MSSALFKPFSGTVPHVWTGLDNLINLADAADVPVCGGIFSISAELISTFRSAQATSSAYDQILLAISVHADALWEFVRSLSPDYIRDSDEMPARLARKAIGDFKQQLDKASRLYRARFTGSKFKRALLFGSMKDDLEECRKEISKAHTRFQDTVRHIRIVQSQASALTDDTIRHLTVQAAIGVDNLFNISGAIPLRPGAVHVVSKIAWSRRHALDTWDDFWRDTYVADVDNKRATVKMYYDRSGGEEAFLRDVKLFGRNVSPHLPQVVAYSHESVPPYIVLGSEFSVPFKTGIGRICVAKTQEVAICDVWRMEAVTFLVENNPTLDYMYMRDAILRARIDSNGNVILAPIRDLNAAPIWFLIGEGLGGIDFVTRIWFLQLYGRVELRPLRPLYYALGYGGAPSTLLSVPKSDLADPAPAAARLQRWWPKQWLRRELLWPAEDTPRWPLFGDVGVFEPGPRGLPVWRSLVNLCDELPSFVVHAPGMRDTVKPYERLGPLTFRKTVSPASSICGTDAVPTEDSQSSDGRIIEFPYSHFIPRSQDFHFLYFARNAGKIAQQHGVNPWDLVFVTKRSYTLRSTLPNKIIRDLKRPLHAYFYINLGPVAHFTYRDDPYPDMDTALMAELSGSLDVDFSAPFFTLTHEHPKRSWYVQLERWEFDPPKAPGLLYTYKEPKVRMPPPDIHRTSDVDGIIVLRPPLRASIRGM